MIAFATAVEAVRIANRMSGRELYRWVLLSKDGGPVRASNGITVTVDMAMTEFYRQGSTQRRPDMVLVCSGLGVERFKDPEVYGWLRLVERQGTTLGALCTGAYVLARAGLLNGYKCAIHWENLGGFQETFPDIEVCADLFEVDRNRYTCSGGTAALDMMLYLIQQLHGGDLATKVSEQCLVDRMRNPHDRQRLPLRARLGLHNPKLIAAIELMEANLAEPLEQDVLANYVGLSRRQLERLFRRHLGRAPAHYYLELRLERARHLLYQSDLAIVDIALACGFVSASHFSKCYRQMYGKSPREERSNIAPLEPVMA
ncbi:MAG TPA: GlxA family transcriptional regulator [Alphaproteobacteria bacterium]|nr:GlxA family transcriptional regulator [Alphaproteobacteria bacterium]